MKKVSLVFAALLTLFFMSCVSGGQGGGKYIGMKNLKSLQENRHVGKKIWVKAEFRGTMKDMIGGKLIEAATFTDTSMADNMGSLLNFWAIYPASLKNDIKNLKNNNKYTLYGTVIKKGTRYFLKLESVK